MLRGVLLSGRQPWCFGFTTERRAVQAFRLSGRRAVCRPPSPTVSSGFILPRALPSSSEPFAPCPPPVARSARLSACVPSGSASPGVPVPLRDAAVRTVFCPGFPTRCACRPGVPPALDGLRCCRFVGLFHPTAAYRVRSPGVCPPPRSRVGFRRPLPSCRLSAPACPSVSLGAPACAPPSSGPCSPRRVRCARQRFRSPRVRAPPELSLPRVPVPAPSQRLHATSVSDLRDAEPSAADP